MVIDLDVRRPAPGRGPPRAGHVAVRPVAIVAVVLVVLALGGSAAPMPGLRRVLAVDNTSGVFTLAQAALFTADFGRAPGRQATVRRHPLGAPAPRWSAELPQPVGSLEVVEPARVLAVGPPPVLMTTSVDAPRTTFLDSDTGELLWSTTTDRILHLTGTGALMTRRAAGSAVLRRADLRTGRTLWSREPGAGSHLDTETMRALLEAATGAALSGFGSGIGIRPPDDLGDVDPGRCAATSEHLACPTSSGRLGVWQIPAQVTMPRR